MQYALDSTYFFMVTRNIITKVLNWIGGVFEQNHDCFLPLQNIDTSDLPLIKIKRIHTITNEEMFLTLFKLVFFFKMQSNFVYNPKKQISGAFKGACPLMLVQFTNSFLKWCNKLYRCNTECQFSSRFKYTTL